MSSTGRKKGPNKRSRRSRPGLHHFLLWALMTWVAQRVNHRKTHNPFAAPASRRVKVPKAAKDAGGADPRPRATKSSRPAAKPAAKPAPMYREGAGGDDIDAEVMDDVADEDVTIDEGAVGDDDIEIFEIPRGAIEAAAS